MQYDYIDESIIRLLQGNLPVTSQPFLSLANELNISEQTIVSRILALQKKGKIKRWGAVLRHQEAGFRFNAMVAWKVEEAMADESGIIMAEFPQVSHCYLRNVPHEFGYALFSMVHARGEDELMEIIEKISQKTGLKDYITIKSVKELKKVSMTFL